MATTHPSEATFSAPETLGLETRATFRREVIDRIDTLPEGAGRLILDLTDTVNVDSAGLGALMLVQRHAADRRNTIVLLGVSDELRFLLTLTKLDELFEFKGT